MADVVESGKALKDKGVTTAIIAQERMEMRNFSSAPLLALTGILMAIASINEAYPEISFPDQDYPALEKLVDELDHNEKNLKVLESQQSKLQSKISRSKVEYAKHSNIVQTLEERQTLEIGALRNQLLALQEHIARLEQSNEEMRQKLLAASEQSVYGNEKLVAQNGQLKARNRALARQNQVLKRKLNYALRHRRRPAVFAKPLPLIDDDEDDEPRLPLPYVQPSRYELPSQFEDFNEDMLY
uniref:Uncharacterized protein n=1 Tax=Ditylenchus dipsaci TaxID=166011 RepID=A0A915EIR0_9BILA